jgi:hypothetical protein
VVGRIDKRKALRPHLFYSRRRILRKNGGWHDVLREHPRAQPGYESNYCVSLHSLASILRNTSGRLKRAKPRSPGNWPSAMSLA